MFVSRSMVSQVITIDKDASVFEAQDKMASSGIRHLPIVDADNRLIGIVTDHVGAVSTDDIVTRPSSQGKYLSVTVTFTARSRAQLDTLYRALTASDKIRHVF